METLYFYYEFIYDFGKPEKGIIFDQTQFTEKYYPKNPYFKLPFRNLFTIYQVKSNCCPYICNSDKAKNNNEFLQKVDEFDNGKVKELLTFHYNKYQGNKNDFLNYCQYLINQDTWIIQDNFKKTILFEEIKELQDKPSNSGTSKIGFQSSLTDEQIQTLFDLLKGKYIDINTNPDHFKAVFKTDPLPDLFNGVNWIEPPVLLSYLIYKLKKDKKIKSQHHWQITGNCFNPKSNFRQLADGFQNTKSGNPKESDLIDKILKTIYTPLQ